MFCVQGRAVSARLGVPSPKSLASVLVCWRGNRYPELCLGAYPVLLQLAGEGGELGDPGD